MIRPGPPKYILVLFYHGQDGQGCECRKLVSGKIRQKSMVEPAPTGSDVLRLQVSFGSQPYDNWVVGTFATNRQFDSKDPSVKSKPDIGSVAGSGNGDIDMIGGQYITADKALAAPEAEKRPELSLALGMSLGMNDLVLYIIYSLMYYNSTLYTRNGIPDAHDIDIG